MSLISNQEYIHWFHSIKDQITNSQIKASLRVNNELFLLYCNLEKQTQEQWGYGIIEQLINDLKSTFTDVNGFSKSNLYAMRQFYLVFSKFPPTWWKFRVAWNFYIGGYQPAQKWLKDRKGRKLEFDDILHYQKIIVALTETYRLMREIDLVKID